MNRMRIIPFSTSLFCIAVLLLELGTSPSHAQTVTLPNAAPFGPNRTEAGQIVIGAGDLIDISVFNATDLSGRLRVDQVGKVILPVGGELQVSGLTPDQAGSAISNRLRDAQIMLDPHVSVQIFLFATQGITMLGEVRNPGSYPLFGPHTLYEALSLAGGPTSSEGAIITITHHSDPDRPIVIGVNTPNYSKVQDTTPVFPGDTIVVSQADMIYVVGDVNAPAVVPIPQGRDLTVINVLAICRGWTPTALPAKATIIRKTATGTQVIPVDFNRILKNTSPNLVLQASDTLFFPHSGLKKFLQYALPAATQGAVGAAEVSVTR